MRELARAQTGLGVRVLSEIAADIDAPASARVAAVGLLFERGWGKAASSHAENASVRVEVVMPPRLEELDRKTIEHDKATNQLLKE